MWCASALVSAPRQIRSKYVIYTVDVLRAASLAEDALNLVEDSGNLARRGIDGQG
jgi:hypothetical protein